MQLGPRHRSPVAGARGQCQARQMSCVGVRNECASVSLPTIHRDSHTPLDSGNNLCKRLRFTGTHKGLGEVALGDHPVPRVAEAVTLWV